MLLLSFVLVQAFGSFNRVRAAEGEESRRLAFEYEVAGYFDDDIAIPIQTALICYGRAVVEVEWPALSDGIQLHPLPTEWAAEVDVELAEIAAGDDTDQPYGTLLGAERDRANARGKRLIEAEPAVPFSVRLLMVLVSAVALAAIAAFTLPYISRGVQIGALVVMAIVFMAMLDDLRDRPQVRRRHPGRTGRDGAAHDRDDRRLRPTPSRRCDPLRRAGSSQVTP